MMSDVAVEKPKSALEQEIRALWTGDMLVAVEGSPYCYTVIDSKGRMWVGTHEHYARRAMLQGFPRENHNEEEVMFTSVRESEDDDTAYNVLRIAALSDMEVFGRLYLEMSRYDDDETEAVMDVFTRLAGIEVKIPEDDETQVSRVEYLIALKEMAKKKTLVFDRQAKMLVTIEQASLQTSMQGPYLHIQMGATALFGEKMVDVTKYCQAWEERLKRTEMQFTPATPEQIAASIAYGRELSDKFISPNGYVHAQYEGNTYTPSQFGRVTKFTKSRVVIDPKGCQTFDTQNFRSLMALEGVEVVTNDDDEITIVENPTDEQVGKVLPFLILFNLTTSRWAVGNVKHAKPVQHREDAFEQVVLAESRKRLVRALTSFHNDAGKSVDIIDGKGGGNIFLLDGAPGTGKTLTAEATAEELKRILYKVSLGELGSDVGRLETTLTKILGLAERWDAVLLIDEADVFLEKRSSENLARNAVVAVFLRLLEYFGGILFMTTNRGDNLDEAFLSRVTLGLHFRKPDDEGQTAIWNGLLRNAGVKLTERDIQALVGYGINGREIKNAINTARALAAQDGKPVNTGHIREILDARQLFIKEVAESTRQK